MKYKHICPFISLLSFTLGLSFAQAKQSSGKGIDLRPEFEKRGLAVPTQGKRGACQVFGMTGVMEYHLSTSGHPVELSEQYLMWAVNKTHGYQKKTEGFNPDQLLMGLLHYGICAEEQMPYVIENTLIEAPPSNAIKDAQTRRMIRLEQIKHFSSDLGFTNLDLKRICSFLDQGQPLSVTFCWPHGLYDDQIVDQEGFLIDHQVTADKNGHGFVVAGYQIDPKIPGGGYFIVRNSWGTIFCKKGYVYISFAYAKKYGIDAYRVTIGK